MEKTIDFSKAVVTLEGKPFADENGGELKIGTCISQMLANGVCDDSERAISLAKKIKECKVDTVIEPHDITFIKEMVKDPKNGFINIVKVQINELLS